MGRVRSSAIPAAAALLLLVFVLLLAACSTLRVTADRYPKADFSSYRTYAWMTPDALIRPPGAAAQDVSPLTVRRIREAIASQLQRKGYRAVPDADKADFVVSFTVGARDRIDPQAYPDRYRGPWFWDWYMNEPDLRVYREGTLSIDIFDGASSQPVWHGRARKEISGADTAGPGPLIDRAVAAILKKFPSRGSTG